MHTHILIKTTHTHTHTHTIDRSRENVFAVKSLLRMRYAQRTPLNLFHVS